ncbi:MAG: hypothetical protein ACFFDH_09295, partial [Promethearchaeota archaeon]
MKEIDQNELKILFKNEIIKKAKKIRGKHAPISEGVNNIFKPLKIENFYDLSKQEKHFYFFTAKNYSKQPKLRYFLAISIANNSSDLLVQLSREYAVQNKLKIIQYSIFPKTLRVQLLLLKEIEKIEDYAIFLKKLNEIRKDFRSKLIKIKN